jgi:hypothetical protein
MDRREQYINLANKDWALYPVNLASWIKEHPIKRPRVNGNGYVLGLVLACISGDDSSCFNEARQQFMTPGSPEELRISLNDGRLTLLDRLHWEMTEPLVPPFIRKRLSSTYAAIEQKPWVDKITFDEAYGIWRPVQQFVLDSVEDYPTLRLAVECHKDLSTYVGQAYQSAKAEKKS